MFEIPQSFRNNGEDYITVPVINAFLREHGIKTKYTDKREELLQKIVDYGNQDYEKALLVLEWIDNVIQEGIKDIHLRVAPVSRKMEVLCEKREEGIRYFERHLTQNMKKNICQNVYGEEFSLINVKMVSSSIGDKFVFMFCKRLYTYDSKKRVTKCIDYPVVSEYYIDGGWLIVKAKPKSDLYVYSKEAFNIEKNDSTTTEKQVKEIFRRMTEMLEIQDIDSRSASIKFKRQMFELLNKYTTTPKEIVDIMANEEKSILSISKQIEDLCTVEDKCYNADMGKDIENDIKNIVEKYLSINWKDKDIFIKDRDAYPVKLSATDEEESKIEQTAAALEPLQTKALFFDNKKMLYKNKSCDGIIFKWKRNNPINGQDDEFKVRMGVTPKGECIFKFTEYTVKEDMENVIFSIIGIK